MRAALDVGAWSDELVGGRVLHDGTGWVDAATLQDVQLRAWLVDADTAGRWCECHRDALDAWVLATGAGWAGVRVDTLGQSNTMALLTAPTLLSADLSPTGHRVTLPWATAAKAIRQAGLVPLAGAGVAWLARRPPGWWGMVALRAGRSGLDAATRRLVLRFERQGGRLITLCDAASGQPSRLRETTMRDTDVLDVLERMEGEADPARAIAVLCAEIRQRLAAGAAGVANTAGTTLEQAGTADQPPASWLQSVAQGVGPTRLVTASWRLAAAAAGDAAGVTGVLWVTWPAAGAEPSNALDVLSTCARLAAGRLGQRGRLAVSTSDGPSLVGDSPAMTRLRAYLQRASRTPFPVLLLGESGVGKELCARHIHAASVRRHRRFVAVNAAALPDDLLEAELFGHGRGAFTGAVGERAGVFEEADGGTLFLDEVGDLSPRAQVKLLRALQEGEVRRLGESGTRRVDVRVIAATNTALDAAVEAGRFRADLYYRLAVVCVRIPPLRERPDDLPALAAHLWAECANRVGTCARLHPGLIEQLQWHHWPGNVRELQNVLAMLAVDAPRRGVVLPSALAAWHGSHPSAVTADRPVSPARAPVDEWVDARGVGVGADESGTVNHRTAVAVPLEHARRAFDAALVRDALVRAGGRRTVAARQLGVSRQGLSKLVRRLGLDLPGVQPS